MTTTTSPTGEYRKFPLSDAMRIALMDPADLPPPGEVDRHARILRQLRLVGVGAEHLSCLDKGIDRDLPTTGWDELNLRLSKGLGHGMLVTLGGARGTGKTQLATSLMYHAHQLGGKSLYTTAEVMRVMILHHSFEKGGPAAAMTRFCDADLLVIDEIDLRRDSTHDHLLATVVDGRYRERRDTVLVTNMTKEQFQASMPSSILSRMAHRGGYVAFDWADFRKPELSKVLDA